jgi:DNA repair exonuclease SbcCD ATPase subunit
MPKEPKEEPKPSTLQQISDLERQIHGLRSEAARELRDQIKEAKAHIAELEKQLAELTDQETPVADQPKRTRRPSLTDEELHSKILNVLAYEAQGISGKGIADKIEVNYPRVSKFIADSLAKNSKAFRHTGSGAGRRYFLP